MLAKNRYTYLLIAFWVFLALINLGQQLLATILANRPLNFLLLGISQISWLIWIIFTPFVVRIIQRLPLNWNGTRKAFFQTLAAILGLSILHVSAYVGTVNFVWQVANGEWLYPWKSLLLFVCPQILTYNVLIFGIIIGVAKAVEHYLEAQRLQVTASNLETELAQAKLIALRAQLQPHFLFNTHNAINTLILKKENEKAVAMLSKLSELLRRVLRSNNSQFIPLQDEIDTLKLYLDIHQERFGQRLKIDYQIDLEALGCQIPNLLLQPLVENAIKHGISKTLESGKIIIRAKKTNQTLTFQILDDGPGFHETSAEISEGVGLSTTRERLRQTYKEGASLHYGNRSEGGFQVTLSLPCHATAF